MHTTHPTPGPHRRPRYVLRGSLALVIVTAMIVAVAGAFVFGSPDEQVEAVATQADPDVVVDPLTDPDGPGFQRNLSQFARGDQIRAEAQAEEDAALAAAAQMAEQEAAAQAAQAEAAAAEAAAAEAAAAESAALEFAAALAEAEAAAPPPPPPPAPTQAPAPPAVQGDPFDALAQCESGRNPNAYNPAGPYYGAFQFLKSTWNIYKPGVPTDYSYADQKAVAQRHQAARGWAPWPSCARQLGLL